MTALEKWKNDFKEFISELSMPRDDYKGIMQYINEVPNEALEQQPCDDCISRAKAIEEADKLCLETAYDNEKVIEMLNDLPSVGKDINVTTNEDCISRQAVLALPTSKTRTLNGEIVEEEVNIELIKALPSVTPKEKTGRWIFDEILNKHYYCSECKSMGVDYWDYCPNCGAKMQEVEK